jgi:hypothetical protein
VIESVKSVVLPTLESLKEESKAIEETKHEEVKSIPPIEDKHKHDPYIDPFFKAYFKK